MLEGCWDLGEYWCSEGGEGVGLMRIVRAQVEVRVLD